MGQSELYSGRRVAIDGLSLWIDLYQMPVTADVVGLDCDNGSGPDNRVADHPQQR
jgi:hypothetical protein